MIVNLLYDYNISNILMILENIFAVNHKEKPPWTHPLREEFPPKEKRY